MERVLPVPATKVTDEGRLRAFVAELGLKPGQTVEAKVAAMLSDGLARLIIADRPLDVRTPQPLPVGQTLTLTVERQGQAVRLILGALPPAEGSRPGPASQAVQAQTLPAAMAMAKGALPSANAASATAMQLLMAQVGPAPAGSAPQGAMPVGPPATAPAAGMGPPAAPAMPSGLQAPAFQGPANPSPTAPAPAIPASTIPAPTIPASPAPVAPIPPSLAQATGPAAGLQANPAPARPAGAPMLNPAPAFTVDATAARMPAAPAVAVAGAAMTGVATGGPAAAPAAGLTAASAPAAVAPAAGSGTVVPAMPVQAATQPAAAAPTVPAAAAPTVPAGGSPAPGPAWNAPLAAPAAALRAAAPGPTGAAPVATPATMAGAAGAVAALVAMAARDAGSLRAGMDGAQVATAARGAPDAARLAGARDGAERPDAVPRAALTAAVRQAAGRQESLAPLFADLAAVAGGKAPDALRAMPDPVLRAMAAVLGFRVPVEAAAAPQALARAVAGSGTFLEARLAALPAGAEPPPDLKAALAGLKQALSDWRMSLPAATPDEAAGGGIASRPGAHARPPLRGGLPEGQMPAAPSIGAFATPSEVALILADRTESALARILLLQAASLPDGREAARPDAPVQTSVEVPLRVGAETAMMQMLIVRDEADGKADGRAGAGARSWTLRFAMDAEPLGPIHAAVKWQAGHVGVQLWAERDGTAERLAAARTILAEALEASAFTIDDLTIAAGRPDRPGAARQTPPSRLDRLS